MGNPVLGEVTFEVRGKAYTFKLGTYGQALLERKAKQPMGKFFQRPADQWGVDDLLSVFWAGLQRHHKLTEEQVADLMDEIGPVKAMQIVTEAIELASPKPEGQGAAAENPPMTEPAPTGTAQ